MLLMMPIAYYQNKQGRVDYSNYDDHYVSVELCQLFGSLYGGCDFLNSLSKIKNVHGRNEHNREPKLILKGYCVKLVDLAYNNG